MSEIHLIVQDDYIAAFLELIQKMPQIRVQGVKPTLPKSKNQRLLEQLPLNDPLRKAIRTRPRTSKTLEQIMQMQNYQKTNWVRLREVANSMDIQEPIELLLEQLKS
jgi:c-di-GMP-related signal transduction protein